MEYLSAEVKFNTVQNTLFNFLHRPSNGLIDLLKSYLKKLFIKSKNQNKMYHIACDFKLNLLDHENLKTATLFSI